MDDLEEYLATLPAEDRAEIERLWALPLDEFMAQVDAHEEVLTQDEAVRKLTSLLMQEPQQ